MAEVLKNITQLPPKPDCMNLSADIQRQSVSLFAAGEGYSDYILTTCPAVVHKSGSCIIADAREFCNLISEYNKDVGFHLEPVKDKGDRYLIVQCGRSKSKFNVLRQEELMVQIPKDFHNILSKANNFNLSNFLKECLKLKSFQETGDEFRTWKETIRAIIHPNQIVQLDIAEGATFGRNIYQCMTTTNPTTYYFIVNNLAKAYQMFKNSTEGFVLGGDNYICISDNSTYYFVKTPESTYPNVDRIWNQKLKNRKFKVSVNLNEFKPCIKRASIFTRKEGSKKIIDAVWLIFKNGVLHIVCERKFHEEIDYVGNMPDYRSSYSPLKIHEALKNIYSAEEVFIEIADSHDNNEPIIISDGLGLEVAIAKMFTRSNIGDL